MMNKVFLANIQQLFTEKVCLVLRVYLRCDVYILNFGYVYHLKCWIPCQPSTYTIRGVAELSFPAGIVRMLRGLVTVFQHERTGHRKTNVIRQAVLEILIIFFVNLCIYCVHVLLCCVFYQNLYILHGGGGSINLMYGHPTTHFAFNNCQQRRDC